MIGSALALLLAASAPPPSQTAAGSAHVLLVTGLSGEPRFAAAFHTEAASIYDAAKARWVRSDSSLVYLAEDPALDPARITARATRDGVAAAIAALGARSAPGDVLLIVLIGHGSGQGADSRLNLPGPDATAADFATWLAPLAGRLVVLVNASSGSGDFVPVLSGKDRVVVTATKSAIGHTLGAAGGIGAVATICAMRDSRVPPTLNLVHPAPEAAGLDCTPLRARSREVRAAIVNAFGFGGQNAALVFRRWDES